MAEIYDTIIIGGGAAAFGAAIYAGRFEMKTLLIAESIGGAILNTNDVSNYPGFERISGLELIEKLQSHAKQYNIQIKNERVESIEKKENFMVRAANEYHSKTIILATGTEWKKLGVPGEKEFTGKGVHYCALCDGAFYKDKIVAVIGGSDTAAKEALLLTEYARKVYIIYRKEKIRAEPIIRKRVDKSTEIEIINNTNVVDIKGDRFVSKVILDKDYNSSRELALDAVFIAIGHTPLSALAKQLSMNLNEKGEIMIDRHGFTNIEGAFAAGDVVDSSFKQAITGVAEGVEAAFNAYNRINN